MALKRQDKFIYNNFGFLKSIDNALLTQTYVYIWLYNIFITDLE